MLWVRQQAAIHMSLTGRGHRAGWLPRTAAPRWRLPPRRRPRRVRTGTSHRAGVTRSRKIPRRYPRRAVAATDRDIPGLLHDRAGLGQQRLGNAHHPQGPDAQPPGRGLASQPRQDRAVADELGGLQPVQGGHDLSQRPGDRDQMLGDPRGGEGVAQGRRDVRGPGCGHHRSYSPGARQRRIGGPIPLRDRTIDAQQIAHASHP